MKTYKKTSFLHYAIPVLVAVALIATNIGTSSASSAPYISIVTVDEDKSVTLSGANFPAGQKFTVRMGAYGTYALGGTTVGTVETTASMFSATFDIPEAVKGAERIAIRVDSEEGYYAYNWFYNAAAPAVPGTTPVPSGYTGYATVSITDVERNMAVGVEIINLPADQTFTARMGEYGTMALGGIEVGTFDSKDGGKLKTTFSIPAALADRSRIAIRMDSPEGFYAYNWFWNNSTGSAAAGTEPATLVYTGIPTIHIDAVVRDTTVIISGMNFPADETFTVTMGDYGTKGMAGIEVGTYKSGTGGDFSKTFDIPAELAGRYRIAIRLETESGAFYTYNWFYNNTTE